MPESIEARAKILVVDDNEQNRALVEATLDAEGHTAIVASSGGEALAAFQREIPDCVLLDVRMPGMDGFAVCERLRALPGGADVPIIFLTALRDVETFDRALRAGGDDFLTKPVRPTELVVRVQAALKVRRLGAELREHYAVIRRQREDLVRVGLQKEMLTAFVVHDLKNPVATIDLLAQSLARDPALSADARETAAQVRGAARQLMRLIHNLLDVSKSEEGKLEPKRVRVDAHELLGEVSAEFAAQAQAARVVVKVRCDAPSLSVDRDLVRRVLENLMENAIRHAPRESTVDLTAKRDPTGTVIQVCDRGAGIPADMRERVFERFVQLDASIASSRAGRGLGLAFCKVAVEAHGGRIWVEDSAPGTTICIRLPDDAA
jgi:two-component system, sensor histidine kinase and response regulator